MLTPEELSVPLELPAPALYLADLFAATPVVEYEWDWYSAFYPDLSVHWGERPQYEEEEDWDPEDDETEEEVPQEPAASPRSDAPPTLDPAGSDAGPGYVYEPFAPYLSYRSAATLYFTLQDLLDTFVDSPELLLEDLPPLVSRVVDFGWLERFAGSIRDLQYALAAGVLQRPRCTAEELALHLSLQAARGSLAELAEGATDPEPWWRCEEDEDLALEAERARAELRLVWECIFEDDDVLMLYNRSMDGVEDSELGAQLFVANLHPKDWFTSFYGDEVPTLAQL